MYQLDLAIKKIKAPIGDENLFLRFTFVCHPFIKKIKAPIGDENENLIMF